VRDGTETLTYIKRNKQRAAPEVDAFGTGGVFPVRVEKLPHPDCRDRTRWRPEVPPSRAG